MSNFFPQQLSLFTSTSLRAQEILSFDPLSVMTKLKKREGERVLAVDMGGHSCQACEFIVRNGMLQQADKKQVFKSSLGAGYLNFLQRIGDKALQADIPVVISSAGVIKGNRYVESFNIATFLEDFNNAAAGDFHSLMPTFQLLINDAVAGTIAATTKAFKFFPKTQAVIYIINGSGLGGAVYQSGKIYACEPGEVPIVSELNEFHQRKQRTINGESYTTIEQVGASKAGIEDIYYQLKGELLDGKAISKLWQTGDEFARRLYQNSALITAHAVLGLAKEFGLLTEKNQTTVVFHGGIFHVQGYEKLIHVLLKEYLGFRPHTYRMIRKNPGLEGAAIAALAGIC